MASKEMDEIDEMKKKLAQGGPRIEKKLDIPGKLMVSGIPKKASFNEKQLEAEFSVFGPVAEVSIIRRKSTGVPKGFAFVTFKNPPDSEKATKGLEGKDIGGEAPLHCARAVVGFIKQSQLASSRGGGDRGRGGGRGRGGERGRGGMDRGGGFRGMRGGGRPPHRGGRGGGPPGGFRGHEMHYREEEEYYEEEYFDEFGGGFYHDRAGAGPPRGGPRGRPPPRGLMRGARGGPPMRGRGGPPQRGGPGSMKRPLLPSPHDDPSYGRGGPPRGRGGPPRGRGGPPRGRGGPPPRGRGRGPPRPMQPVYEEYYGEEEEYAGGEEYFEEDPYSNGAEVYPEEEQYVASADMGYYGVPEQGGAPPARKPPVRGGGHGPMTSRGAPGGRGASRGPPGAGLRRPPKPLPLLDDYGYQMEEAGEPLAVPPRRRAAPPPQALKPEPVYKEDYYGDGDYAAPPAPAPRQRAPAGRGPPAPRRGADSYTEDLYGVQPMKHEVPERAMKPEGDFYDDGYGAPPPSAGRRSAAPPPSRPREAPSRRKPEHEGYADIADYVGQGLAGVRASTKTAASRFDEYRGQGSSRDPYAERGRPAASRREEPYADQRVASETDAYMSYPPSSRGTARESSRKRPLDPYSQDAGDARRDYDEYRGSGVPSKRDRVDREYENYSSRQEGAYRRL